MLQRVGQVRPGLGRLSSFYLGQFRVTVSTTVNVIVLRMIELIRIVKFSFARK